MKHPEFYYEKNMGKKGNMRDFDVKNSTFAFVDRIKKQAEKSLKELKATREGKKFRLVQTGPKTWVEKEITDE